jgi:hypothetical protein
MKELAGLFSVLVILALVLASVCRVRAQAANQNLVTYYNSEISGMTIQVNATAETRPTENLTVLLSLLPVSSVSLSNVHVDDLSFTVLGFINGTREVPIGEGIVDSNFQLNGIAREYDRNFTVPDGVSDRTFGEIVLNYSVALGSLKLSFENATFGFYMTSVENTFLESIETQLRALNESYTRLNDTYNNLISTYKGLTQSYAQLNDAYNNLTVSYIKLNQTFMQLQRNYTTLQADENALADTRQVAVILAITTVFFVATTVFLIMRKPRESW